MTFPWVTAAIVSLSVWKGAGSADPEFFLSRVWHHPNDVDFRKQDGMWWSSDDRGVEPGLISINAQ